MSNQRGLVQRIERKLENTVGDAVARVFGGSIVPQEVEALLRREASDGVQTLQGGRLLAPNEYVITLSGSDFEKVNADRDVTSDTFARHLGGYLREQGWQTYGDVVVRFEQSQNLHTGQYRARGVVNPDASPHPTAGAPAPAQSKDAFTAEPGVPPMSDNPSYRGDQGQGRPADDYYEDRYARPLDEQRGGAPEQRGPYPPEDRGGYAPPNDPNYPPRGGYPSRAATSRAIRARAATSSARRPATAAATTRVTASRLPATARPRRPRTARRPVVATAPRRMTTTTAAHRAATRSPATAVPSRGRPTRIRVATSSSRATPARAVTAVRTTPSPTTPATSKAVMANRAATTTTASPPAAATPGTARRRPASTRVPATTSPCSSTTAADAPTSCAKVPTSSAAARTRSSGCPTPGCRGGIWRSAGTARSRCSRPQLDQRHDGQQRARPRVAAGRR